jgi:uncharacterized membrane protein
MLSARFIRERVQRKRDTQGDNFLTDYRTYVYNPFSPVITAFVIFTVVVLFIFVFFGLISAAFGRIGFSAEAIALLLFAVLVGSVINIPLFTFEAREPVMRDTFVTVFGMTYRVPPAAVGSRKTVVAINVGGAVIPSMSRFIFSSDFKTLSALRSSVLLLSQ